MHGCDTHPSCNKSYPTQVSNTATLINIAFHILRPYINITLPNADNRYFLFLVDSTPHDICSCFRVVQSLLDLYTKLTRQTNNALDRNESNAIL